MSKAQPPKPPWIMNGLSATPEQLAALKGLRIMIGTPMYGGMAMGQYTVSSAILSKLAALVGCHVEINALFNESLVQRGRNAVSHYFMKSDCDYLLFIDADIGYEPQQALELILMAKLGNHPVVGASYSKKAINWERAKAAAADGVRNDRLAHCSGSPVVIFDGKTQGGIFDPMPVKHLGNGFMLIHRTVFERFQASYPDYWYKNNHIPFVPNGETVWAYFHCIIDADRNYLSEDYYFCRQIRKMGITPMVAPWITLSHFGTYVYEGCLACTSGTYVHDVLTPEAKLAAEKKEKNK